MYQELEKKQFDEPLCIIMTFNIADIIASSLGGEDDWDAGGFEIQSL